VASKYRTKGGRSIEGDRVMLVTKDLVFKEKPTKKLMKRYIRLYIIEEIVLKNVVKLKLLASMRIYPVVHVRRVMRYREPGKGHKVEEPKPVEINRVEK